MIRKLPVLLKTDNDLYKTIELKLPSSDVLADTKEAVNTSNQYVAVRNLIAGCTSRISGQNDITEPDRIKLLVGKMSNKNLEYFAREIMIGYYDGDDYVEGVYSCPRCGEKIISEKKDMEGIIIDTRDRMSELKVAFMENESELEFFVEFTEPVIIESEAGNTEVASAVMRYPTVEDMIQAYSLVGDSNSIKFQLAQYAYCLVKVNNKAVDDNWRRSYGYKMFRSIKNVNLDLNKKIGEIVNRYGVDPRIEKTCSKCGKTWKPYINSLNFFASALQ